MSITEKLKNKVLNETSKFDLINKEDAMLLYLQPIEELCNAANEIRQHFCGNTFDMCTIINAKSGSCSENCRFCAQSAFYKTNIKEYPFLEEKEIVKQAYYSHSQGVLRYALVTSGKALSDKDIDLACKAMETIKDEIGIKICVSGGLLNESQFCKLKKSGATRIHNNLEASQKYFKNICTTHTYSEKIEAINAAKKAGLEVCSGGIIGMGETIEDRIDMVMEIRGLGIKSIPMNFLNPIKDTPFGAFTPLTEEEILKTIAITRFLIPDGFIRLAGGRGLLADKGKKCFSSGANATITGDMLTTVGVTIDHDKNMIKELGFEIKFA